MTPPKNYLKHYAPIKRFFMTKYKLSSSKMDILLFLHSEIYFDKNKYKEYEKLLNFDYNRLSDLLRDGWIVVFRKGVKYKSIPIYCLSMKANNMINSLYKKIDGEEIPTSPQVNHIFAKNVSKKDKRFKDFITNINKLNREAKYDKSLNFDGIYD